MKRLFETIQESFEVLEESYSWKSIDKKSKALIDKYPSGKGEIFKKFKIKSIDKKIKEIPDGAKMVNSIRYSPYDDAYLYKNPGGIRKFYLAIGITRTDEVESEYFEITSDYSEKNESLNEGFVFESKLAPALYGRPVYKANTIDDLKYNSNDDDRAILYDDYVIIFDKNTREVSGIVEAPKSLYGKDRNKKYISDSGEPLKGLDKFSSDHSFLIRGLKGQEIDSNKAKKLKRFSTGIQAISLLSYDEYSDLRKNSKFDPTLITIYDGENCLVAFKRGTKLNALTNADRQLKKAIDKYHEVYLYDMKSKKWYKTFDISKDMPLDRKVDFRGNLTFGKMTKDIEMYQAGYFNDYGINWSSWTDYDFIPKK